MYTENAPFMEYDDKQFNKLLKAIAEKEDLPNLYVLEIQVQNAVFRGQRSFLIKLNGYRYTVFRSMKSGYIETKRVVINPNLLKLDGNNTIEAYLSVNSVEALETWTYIKFVIPYKTKIYEIPLMQWVRATTDNIAITKFWLPPDLNSKPPKMITIKILSQPESTEKKFVTEPKLLPSKSSMEKDLVLVKKRLAKFPWTTSITNTDIWRASQSHGLFDTSNTEKYQVLKDIPKFYRLYDLEFLLKLKEIIKSFEKKQRFKALAALSKSFVDFGERKEQRLHILVDILDDLLEFYEKEKGLGLKFILFNRNWLYGQILRIDYSRGTIDFETLFSFFVKLLQEFPHRPYFIDHYPWGEYDPHGQTCWDENFSALGEVIWSLLNELPNSERKKKRLELEKNPVMKKYFKERRCNT